MDQPSRRPSLVVTGILVGIAVLLGVALLGELLAVVPGYEKLFREFRLRLPASTVVTLDISRWFVKYWYVLVVMALPGLVVVAIVSHSLRRPAAPRWLRVLWFVLLLGLPVAAHVFLWASILHPYFQLLEGLSGGKKA